MSDIEDKVNCKSHGLKDQAFVCHHLLKGKNLGFNLNYDPDSPDELFPVAWCDDCEHKLDQTDGWNEESESFADIKLICSECYQIARDHNWVEDNEIISKLITESCDFLSEKQDKFADEYKINEFERWDWYQESGKLIFSHNNQPMVETEIHFVGSISIKSNTWMWAWANSHLAEKVKNGSRKIKEKGEELNLMKLSTGLWKGDEIDGWEMTAILAKEMNAIGAYRTPNQNGFTYMVVTSAKFC